MRVLTEQSILLRFLLLVTLCWIYEKSTLEMIDRVEFHSGKRVEVLIYINIDVLRIGKVRFKKNSNL